MSPASSHGHGRRAKLLASLLILAVAVVGLLPEAFGASGTRYSACVSAYGEKTVVRLNVGGGVECDPPGEWKAVWYEYPDRGGQGARGPTGPRGLRGLPGPRGPRGVRGIRGSDGTDGKDGVDGNDGVDGKDGLVGARGPKGETGSMATYVVSTPCAACGDNLDGVRTGSTATCDKGDVALSGGFLTDGIISASSVIGTDKPVGWQAPAVTSPETEGSVGSRAHVICLDTPPLRRTSR